MARSTRRAGGLGVSEVFKGTIGAVRADPRMVAVTLLGGILYGIPVLGGVIVGLANGVAVAFGYRAGWSDSRPHRGFGKRLFLLLAG